MRISQSDFEAWWNSPVGLEFRKLLKENLDKLAYGTMTESFARDHIGNAVQVGQFQATMFYHNLDYSQLKGD